MSSKRNHITVFEHQQIKVSQTINGIMFDDSKLKALQSFYGEKGVPYYSLIHNGIKFNQYVGIIQIDNLLIEVLPKADKKESSGSEHDTWRNILIDMMRAVDHLSINSTSKSHLKIKYNTILDLYIELFINEIEYLIHTGLIKQYRKEEGNRPTLKGNLIFSKHIQQNLIHKERFYVRHTTYDNEHLFHFILHSTILLIKQINTNTILQNRINGLSILFPEMPSINISESTFQRLIFNRKNERYRSAIEISKLLLLKYHPDMSCGRNNILALMFDMNKLWERFIYVSIKKHIKECTISAQTSKNFWQPENGSRATIRPDIVINNGNENCFVIDTKWKCLENKNPSINDLRQMYVYHEYFNAKKVALVYPGEKIIINGTFFNCNNNNPSNKECSILTSSVNSVIGEWQKQICELVTKQLSSHTNNPSP